MAPITSMRIGFLTVFVLAAGAVAWAGGPATQPAPDPAEVFRTFLMDIETGKGAAVPAVCQAQDPDAQALVRDFQAVATSMQELREAATIKFGPDAAEAILPSLPTAGDMEDINQTITGDHAQIEGPDVWPVQMVRVGGQWKLDVDWLVHSDNVAPNAHWFGAMAEAMHKTAADINSGRLGTADAATEAMTVREQAIPDTAATQPATGP